MVETGHLKAPSDWQTERDPLKVAVLGKLGEEVNELGNALFRALIQGYDGANPETGELNADWIFKEMADVRAMTYLVEKHFSRTIDIRRVAEKLAHKEAWLKLIHLPPENGECTCPCCCAWRGEP